jgi:hypothetical protein
LKNEKQTWSSRIANLATARALKTLEVEISPDNGHFMSDFVLSLKRQMGQTGIEREIEECSICHRQIQISLLARATE